MISKCVTLILFAALSTITHGKELSVYIGTYTRGESEGIYRATLDTKTGKLSEAVLAAECNNPSFLDINQKGDRIYAVGEGGPVELRSFSIEASGDLKSLNELSSGGSGPCHISISPNGKFAAVANYGGGSVSSYSIDSNGQLVGPASTIQHEGSSVHPKRQTKPHAHSINFSIDSRFAYAADLGTDKIYVYAVDEETGELTVSSQADLPGGSGPRHFAVHPSGKWAFLINEMTRDVTSFRVDTHSGELSLIAKASTLPPDADSEGSTAEIVIHPSGGFVYGSNRGHDSIVVFSLDKNTGKLTRVENEPIQGEIPRNFAVTPDGKWLLAAGQRSHSIAVFSIDPGTGELDYTGNRITVDSPVCIRFLKRG
jgi:6-phosphogluconolactonase